MTLTNIELYEALKKDLSEESARLIAEVFPAAAELVTTAQLLQVESRLNDRISSVEQRLSDRISSLERRLLLFFAVPLWGAVAAAAIKLIAKI